MSMDGITYCTPCGFPAKHCRCKTFKPPKQNAPDPNCDRCKGTGKWWIAEAGHNDWTICPCTKTTKQEGGGV